MPRRNLILLLVLGVFSLICLLHKSPPLDNARVFSESLDIIKRNALDKVDEDDLFDAAMNGMLGRLDKYSEYISNKQLSKFQEELDQQFGGVGVQVTIDPKTRQLVVINPMAGTPAFKAGIRAGDQIVRIGELSTKDMPLEKSTALMRGKPGEQVVLTVLHPGENPPVDIALVREIISVPTVLGDTHNEDDTWDYFLADVSDCIGYVRITAFTEKTTEELEQAVRRLLDHNMHGLILDLRENPGGIFPVARDICDLFLKSGTIVSTRDRDGKIVKTWEAGGKGPFTDFPMVVLVNRDSASASEIVAACLQDNHRATVVGERTWGKGTVQQIIPLENEHGALKLTTASYWRPSGKNIHRNENAKETDDWGVSPDPGRQVKLDDDERIQWLLWRSNRDLSKEAGKWIEEKTDPNFVDRQLEKAVECLREKMKKK